MILTIIPIETSRKSLRSSTSESRRAVPRKGEYTQRVLDYYAEGVDGVVIYESEVLTSPTRLYPARTGMLPMFRTFAQPREALAYLKQLPPD